MNALEIANQLMVIFSPLLMALASLAVMKLNAYIAEKSKNEKLNACLFRLDDAVLTAVKSINQAYVSSLRAANKFDAEAQAVAKAAAVQAAKDFLGEQGLKAAKDILHLSAEAVEEALINKVEAAVGSLKQ